MRSVQCLFLTAQNAYCARTRCLLLYVQEFKVVFVVDSVNCRLRNVFVVVSAKYRLHRNARCLMLTAQSVDGADLQGVCFCQCKLCTVQLCKVFVVVDSTKCRLCMVFVLVRAKRILCEDKVFVLVCAGVQRFCCC